MRTHYPRTPHLPWSPGATSDDVRLADLSGLVGQEVVVTEKLDGENTTLYVDGLHARSLDSGHHPSRAWVKALQSRIAGLIPPGWRVCGENMYARHSLAYDDLDSWFYAFSVWVGDRCLSWDETVRFARRAGVPVPPVLWRGTFDERVLRALRVDTTRQEGYVVRAAAAFDRSEFTGRVGKWVRRAHVQTDQHWMFAEVVANGLSPSAALWDVRSGGTPDVPSLLTAVGVKPDDLGGGTGVERADTIVADVSARLDLWGRRGDARLAGVLAAMTHSIRRASLAPRLAPLLGVPLARRAADLVGLHALLHRPFPDEERRAGLVRLAAAADVGVLHAVAGAVLTGHVDEDAVVAREQVDWSALYADDAGLLAEAPLRPLRAELRRALAERPADAADRCWSEARSGYADGRISTVEEAEALTWRWRDGDFPRLVVMVGPSGSGKSTFASGLAGVDEVVSLDDLRQANGARTDQRANAAVLRAGLERLAAALTAGRTVIWDATSLTQQQRAVVETVARRRDALVTHAVAVVDEELLARRNATREHRVPPDVLATQLDRFSPPYPGQAHRTWYVGPDGTLADVAGAIDAEEP